MSLIETLALGLVIVFVAVALLRLIATPLKIALRLILHSALGFGAVWLLNATSAVSGLSLGLNVFNALTIGILGLPILFPSIFSFHIINHIISFILPQNSSSVKRISRMQIPISSKNVGAGVLDSPKYKPPPTKYHLTFAYSRTLFTRSKSRTQCLVQGNRITVLSAAIRVKVISLSGGSAVYSTRLHIRLISCIIIPIGLSGAALPITICAFLIVAPIGLLCHTFQAARSGGIINGNPRLHVVAIHTKRYTASVILHRIPLHQHTVCHLIVADKKRRHPIHHMVSCSFDIIVHLIFKG